MLGKCPNLYNFIYRHERYFVIIIAVLLYLSFFYRLLYSDNTFWGSDAAIKHYPTREYLRQSILYDHKFPFWTEKVLLGFPLYADMGSQYLNPINVISIILFGSITSYKIVHFFSYLIGAYSFYIFIKRRGGNIFSYIIAVLIFYFNFFHLNHLIHYDIVPVYLLLPLNILLADMYLCTKNKKYIFYQALLIAYGMYWGHPQTTFFLGLCVFLYIFILGSLINIKEKIFYFVFVILISLSLFLPQLIPAYRLYKESSRAKTGYISSQGSLTPELTLSYIFPYLWSTSGYYYGDDVDESFSYTETYIYVGISALALSLIYIFFYNKDRFFWFNYVLLLCVMILAYVGYVPILNHPNFPVISMFRYWSRSVMLMTFSLALLSSEVIKNAKEKSMEIPFDKKSVLLVIFPLLYLGVLHFLNINNPIIINVHVSIIHLKLNMLLKRDIFIWLFLPSLIFIAFLGMKKFKIIKPVCFVYLTIILVFFDLRYFGKDPLSLRISGWNPDPGIYTPIQADYKRVIEEGDLVLGMGPLLNKSYTPYGYTQFLNKNYQEFFVMNNLGKTPRTSNISKVVREDLRLDDLRNYGFTYVRTVNSFDQIRQLDTLDMLREEIPGKYLIKTDGHIKFKAEILEDMYLETVIKYDPNWIIKVNDNVVEPERWENIFIKVPVSKGMNIIEFEYVPFDLIYGFALGMLFTSLFTTLLFLKVNFSD